MPLKKRHKAACIFKPHHSTIENLDEIMKKPYIDGYIFGPHDLAGSYNMLGEHLSEKIRQVMKETISKLRAAEKYICMASVGCTEEIINH